MFVIMLSLHKYSVDTWKFRLGEMNGHGLACSEGLWVFLLGEVKIPVLVTSTIQ